MPTTPPTGESPQALRRTLTQLFDRAHDGIHFHALLEAAGYRLERTTRQVIHVIDPHGRSHPLRKRLTASDDAIASKLAQIDPRLLPQKPTRQRRHSIRCFVTTAEYEEIQARAQNHCLSLSGYLRQFLFKPSKETPPPTRKAPAYKTELLHLRHDLRALGADLSALLENPPADGSFDALLSARVRDRYHQLQARLTTLLKAKP